MGATQSTKEGDDDNLKAVNILDILATKYILTQNFQDMKKLGDKTYCNKLIILTADIIKKFLKEKDITYLSQRVVDGVPVNKKKKASVIYMSVNQLEGRKNPRTPKPFMKKVYNPDGSYRLVEQKGVYPVEKAGSPRRMLIQKLDVSNAKEKDNMCKGIAKFYIKIIANLFRNYWFVNCIFYI